MHEQDGSFSSKDLTVIRRTYTYIRDELFFIKSGPFKKIKIKVDT